MTYPRHRNSSAKDEQGDKNALNPSPSFPTIEQETLAYWEDDKTFQASVDIRPAGDNGANEFVFYDGPPFANGLPHYGHLLTGYAKDLIPRYQTMRGKHVERRFGWDCHGLPAEVEAEKQLGLAGKPDIEKMGIAAFNDACRTSVLKYTSQWERYVTRQARWVDFTNDYKTLDLDYMESVMWAFKTLHDKGLVYEGYKVLPYCWKDQTPLSNTELRMDDDVYKNRQDPALTVAFELSGEKVNGQSFPDLEGVKILAWTTTPWTLPSNLALAVGPDIDYALVESDGQHYLLGESRIGVYEKQLPDAIVQRTFKGSELVGLTYTPLFDFVADTPNAFQVLAGDFVSTENGTGVVHMAPGFGEDDQMACAAANIPVVMTVDEGAKFNSLVPTYEGLHVFDANKPIIADLKARGVVLRHDSYDHSYPHCWRCGTALIYKGVSSWFVEVTKFKDRMFELNQQINWVPGHIKDGQFGKWLANARDWTISRNRFWGSPIPVWKSDDPNYPRLDVYGSLDEIERDFGVRPADLHRPHIDELTRPNPDDPTGLSTMRRVPEVLDCWFESGSMPFAQVHYPFENREWFDHHYPGDYIVEYIGQARGWFYTLHVLATALFDRPAFRNCVSHGIVLGDDGQKMSKSKKNYPDVYEMFDKYGSDAMRWFLMASPILRGGDLIVTEEGVRESMRQVIMPLWNAYYFFGLYANIEGYEAQLRTDSPHVLDRYILAKTHDLTETVTASLDAYDIPGACAAVRSFAEVLTNWYIRRSRSRFWSNDRDAFDTLYTVLETTCRLVAPLAPLVSEEIWRALTGERSVHLADWPDAASFPADDQLVAAMDSVRGVCSAALSMRKGQNLRVRLPLAELIVTSENAHDLQPFVDVITDEVNVKQVRLGSSVDVMPEQITISRKLSVNPRAAGPRLGGGVQAVIKASKTGEWEVVETENGPQVVVCGGVELHEGEYSLDTTVEGDESSRWAVVAVSGGLTGDGFVLLDTHVTPELAAEGLARDAIRAIQQARREAGLAVEDRIELVLVSDDEVQKALKAHEELIKRETLSVSLTASASNAPGSNISDSNVSDQSHFSAKGDLSDDRSLRIYLRKANG